MLTINVPKKPDPLGNIRQIVKGKAPTALTQADVRNVVLKLLEKEGIKVGE